jgi:hypothetical protein
MTINEVVEKGLLQSAANFKAMAIELHNYPNRFPRSVDCENRFTTSDASYWTSGFYSGTLWLLYENSADTFFLHEAEKYTALAASQQYNTESQDIGFIINTSFGNGYRLTGNNAYKDIIVNSARNLNKKFNDRVMGNKLFDSIEDNSQQSIMINNVVTLEMILFSANETKDTTLLHTAITQADFTNKWFLRPDMSCYNVVSIDNLSGIPQNLQAKQGFSVESVWARGQAWALYGFTMMYRFTQKQSYLQAAQGIADYLISQPNMPKDYIPYWDFKSPNIPNEIRDASSAAIMASALIELSTFVSGTQQKKYLDVAEKQIRSLTSKNYLADKGTNGNFILKHSVGNYPTNTEVDSPLPFADYYYVEALMRLKKLMINHK